MFINVGNVVINGDSDMKIVKYEAKGYDEEWNGIYQVFMISAKEHIEIESKLAKKLQKVRKPENIDISEYKGWLMLKSIKKDGKPLPYQNPIDLLSKMPNKLYLVLYSVCSKLNEVSPEDQRFLLTL